MNRLDEVASPGSGKFRPVSPAVTTAVTFVVGALWLTLGQDLRLASAEPAQPAVQASLGTAPLGFADVVQKVTPAVVSVQVKGNPEVDENDLQVPGLPDLPEDSPLNKFFKQFKKRF